MSSVRKLAEIFSELQALNGQVSMDNREQKKIQSILRDRAYYLLDVKALNEVDELRKKVEELSFYIERWHKLQDRVKELKSAYTPEQRPYQCFSKVLSTMEKLQNDSPKSSKGGES